LARRLQLGPLELRSAVLRSCAGGRRSEQAR
jgi:hypothetical protein